MRFLRDLHIDRVKIDQKLLRGARRHPKRRLALTSLLEFATDFGLEVLAEGIETKADFEFAEALNCDGVQGFYLDHPTVFLPQNGALGQSSISAFPVTTGSLIENSNVSV
jgi:EAL domain-containing protein (putative c-di-GMP-specific phosphodiesterase class I)